MKALYWRLFIIWLSCRWVPRFNLGDMVIHNGKAYFLTQGARSPVWSLSREGEYIEAHEDTFRKVRSLKNYVGSFRSGYRFYMGYWYSIWVRGGIKPWMRGCRIWGK